MLPMLRLNGTFLGGPRPVPQPFLPEFLPQARVPSSAVYATTAARATSRTCRFASSIPQRRPFSSARPTRLSLTASSRRKLRAEGAHPCRRGSLLALRFENLRIYFAQRAPLARIAPATRHGGCRGGLPLADHLPPPTVSGDDGGPCRQDTPRGLPPPLRALFELLLLRSCAQPPHNPPSHTAAKPTTTLRMMFRNAMRNSPS